MLIGITSRLTGQDPKYSSTLYLRYPFNISLSTLSSAMSLVRNQREWVASIRRFTGSTRQRTFFEKEKHPRS